MCRLLWAFVVPPAIHGCRMRSNLEILANRVNLDVKWCPRTVKKYKHNASLGPRSSRKSRVLVYCLGLELRSVEPRSRGLKTAFSHAFPVAKVPPPTSGLFPCAQQPRGHAPPPRDYAPSPSATTLYRELIWADLHLDKVHFVMGGPMS